MKISDYDLHGTYGSATICKRFGGWSKAKEIARLKIGRQYNSTEEDYFENLLSVWKSLGRQPLYREMVSPLSKLSISSCERMFGTWRCALEKFIEYTETKDITSKAKVEVVVKNLNLQQTVPTAKVKSKKASTKRNNRTANLRQRYNVLKRDNFICVLCGVSPANNSGCELQIDRIIPWSHGGETVEENLRTLCSQCNLGRSNKE
jgi:HNH endonuclease/Homing endonuclease associated repeat